MSVLQRLPRKLSGLEVAGIPNATMSTCAALQIMDAHTLAVVMFDNRFAPLIEQTIAKQNLGAREITVAAHHVTIKI